MGNNLVSSRCRPIIHWFPLVVMVLCVFTLQSCVPDSLLPSSLSLPVASLPCRLFRLLARACPPRAGARDMSHAQRPGDGCHGQDDHGGRSTQRRGAREGGGALQPERCSKTKARTQEKCFYDGLSHKKASAQDWRQNALPRGRAGHVFPRLPHQRPSSPPPPSLREQDKVLEGDERNSVLLKLGKVGARGKGDPPLPSFDSVARAEGPCMQTDITSPVTKEQRGARATQMGRCVPSHGRSHQYCRAERISTPKRLLAPSDRRPHLVACPRSPLPVPPSSISAIQVLRDQDSFYQSARVFSEAHDNVEAINSFIASGLRTHMQGHRTGMERERQDVEGKIGQGRKGTNCANVA